MYRTHAQQSSAADGPSDETLIRLAQEGRLDAFNQLYERHLPTVYRRVRYVVPAQDIEDVTQEVFITVMRSLKSFKGNAQFTTWLRTLTNRRIVDYYRSRKPAERQQTMQLSESAFGLLPDTSPAANPAHADDRIELRRALSALPEQYQEVILLRFAEELQFNEIAAVQGRSLEATKSLFRRAIAELRKELGEYR